MRFLPSKKKGPRFVVPFWLQSGVELVAPRSFRSFVRYPALYEIIYHTASYSLLRLQGSPRARACVFSIPLDHPCGGLKNGKLEPKVRRSCRCQLLRPSCSATWAWCSLGVGSACLWTRSEVRARIVIHRGKLLSRKVIERSSPSCMHGCKSRKVLGVVYFAKVKIHKCAVQTCMYACNLQSQHLCSLKCTNAGWRGPGRGRELRA